jgi:ferric-dicitrate binding protein FerR (iron transport regulator)
MDDLVLLRSINGQSSPAELDAIDRWLAHSPANRFEYDALLRAWNLAAVADRAVCDQRGLWDRLAAAMDADAATAGSGSASSIARTSRQRTLALMPPSRSGWRRSGVRAALVTAGAAAALLLATRAFRSPEPTVPGGERAMRVLATARGEHAEIRLPDGSRVVLNASSRLKLPMEFGTSSRDLYLDGEAYFEVKHEPDRPFNIRTTHGMVEDRGTRFVVVAYSTDSIEHVAVQEGEVAIRSGSSRDLVLRAGDVGSVASDGTVTQLQRERADDYTAWMDGRVEFDNVTLAEAIRVLERQFDIHVRVTDSALAKKRFTASFSGENVDQSMRALAFLLDARYQRAGPGGSITLTPR